MLLDYVPAYRMPWSELRTPKRPHWETLGTLSTRPVPGSPALAPEGRFLTAMIPVGGGEIGIEIELSPLDLVDATNALVENIAKHVQRRHGCLVDLHEHWWARMVSNRRPLVCKPSPTVHGVAPGAVASSNSQLSGWPASHSVQGLSSCVCLAWHRTGPAKTLTAAPPTNCE